MSGFRLEVERLVAGGDGLGHRSDGRVVFVPRTAPGDRIEAECAEERPGFLRGALVQLLQASPLRQDPPCQHFEECGGCPWLHLRPDAQLHWKEEILRETLRRTAGTDWQGELRVHTSVATGYRDRLRWKVRTVRHHLRVGRFAPRSHDVVEITSCLLPPEGSLSFLPALREELGTHRRLFARLEEIVQDIDSSGESLLTLRFGSGRAPDRERLEELAGRLTAHTGVAAVAALLPGKRRPVSLSGALTIARDVKGLRYQVHGGAFFQTNADLRERFCERVQDLAGTGSSCLDLYCGVGFLTLPLAARFEDVLGVESGTEAVQLAAQNARENGVDNVRFLEADVGRWLSTAESSAFDCVVADPPRSGLGRKAAERVGTLGARKIVLVGCDPVSLARDIRALMETGYAARSLDLFDFFPGSHHMEVVAGLERA